MKSSLKMMIAGVVLATGLSGAAFAKDFNHPVRDEHRVENRNWQRDRNWRRDRDLARDRDRWYRDHPVAVYRGPVVAPHRGYYDAYGVFHYYPW
ncbi:MAG TPA: hypothetical protein VMU28_11015 [Terriglobales bacterium]|nr:hypothetical protein [Terriglobales bacterium]